MQNPTALTLGPREVGISLYYPIQMPLVQPRKWKNGYTFHSVDWADWQCCPGGISGQLPAAEEINECTCSWGWDIQTWSSRFGLLRCFKQNRTEKVSLEQQADTAAACNTNSSLPSLQGCWKQEQSFGCSKKAAALDLVFWTIKDKRKINKFKLAHKKKLKGIYCQLLACVYTIVHQHVLEKCVLMMASFTFLFDFLFLKKITP